MVRSLLVAKPPPSQSLSQRLARLWTLTRALFKGLFTHHAFDHAATMAFYFFLGTIPLLVVISFLLGQLVGRSDLGPLALPLEFLLSGPAGDQLRTELRGLSAAAGSPIAPLSVIGFLWLTSNGFHNLMDVFELLIGASPRSWQRQRLLAIAWVLVTVVIGVGVTWGLLEVNGALDAVRAVPPDATMVARARHALAAGIARSDVAVVLTLIFTLALAAFYRWSVVHPPTIRRRVWPGTFVAMALWVLVSWSFGAWVSTIAHYAVYYGSLASMAVILLWLYLTSLALLVGAEVNARLEGVGNRTMIGL